MIKLQHLSILRFVSHASIQFSTSKNLSITFGLIGELEENFLRNHGSSRIFLIHAAFFFLFFLFFFFFFFYSLAEGKFTDFLLINRERGHGRKISDRTLDSTDRALLLGPYIKDPGLLCTCLL